MNQYEQQQLAEIEKWKQEEPGLVGQTFAAVTKPISWLAAKIIPASAIEKVINGFETLSQNTLNQKELLAKSEVNCIADLKTMPLEHCDKLAISVQNWAKGLAGVSGGALGATGAGGVPLDLATLITLSLRTINKVALCYGFEQLNKTFVLGVLSVSCADNRKAKQISLQQIQAIQDIVIGEITEGAVYDALIAKITTRSTGFSSFGVSKEIAQYMAKRKSLQLVPVVGGVVSSACNIAFVSDVGKAAQCICQEMWLTENHKLSDK